MYALDQSAANAEMYSQRKKAQVQTGIKAGFDAQADTGSKSCAGCRSNAQPDASQPNVRAHLPLSACRHGTIGFFSLHAEPKAEHTAAQLL